ncbi:hypothetical protein, partial [Plantactinospora sp. CA-290183]|uniref:hypothetical protein n=1 Tax=Plantactinospora sp. CA-290183 TaxID=3240006 RepID=UPI003D8FD29F
PVDQGVYGWNSRYGHGSLDLAVPTADVSPTPSPTRAPATAVATPVRPSSSPDPERAKYEEQEERAARWTAVILAAAGVVNLLLHVLLVCAVAVGAIALIAAVVYLPSLSRRIRTRRDGHPRRLP